MKFGFNDLQGDLHVLQNEYHPSAWVTFDGGRAQALANIFPGSLIIYRHMRSGGDGLDLHIRRPDATTWYHEARMACGNDNRVIIQCGNEPGLISLPTLTRWACDIIDAANKDGGTVAVLSFSVCNPPAESWDTTLLPVLRKLAGSRHILLAHEYFLYHGNTSDCIGWFKNAYAACDRAGIAYPKVIIGEYGFDLPGWKASQRERGLLDEEYASKLIWGWNEVYAPAGVIAACIYSWGKGDIWQDFDVSDAGAFMTILKNARLDEPKSIPVVDNTSDPGLDQNLVGRVATLEEKTEGLSKEITLLRDELESLRTLLHSW